MAEISKKWMGGILVLVIVLSSGMTMTLMEDEDYRNCPSLWELNDTTGKYDCLARGISEWCFKLSKPTALHPEGKYRCYLGKPVYQMDKVYARTENDKIIFTVSYLEDGKPRVCPALKEPYPSLDGYEDDIERCIQRQSPNKRITEIVTPFDINIGFTQD